MWPPQPPSGGYPQCDLCHHNWHGMPCRTQLPHGFAAERGEVCGCLGPWGSEHSHAIEE